MHRLRKTALCVILAVFCCASSAYGADDLITWIRRTGGLVDLEIGAVNDKGLRGTKAARDMKKDQIAVHLPAHLAIPLGDGSVTPEENTVILLRQQRDHPEWNASMLPYWESLPRMGASITKENMPQAALHLLQDPVLAASIVVHNAYTKNVFEGGKPALIENFAQELPGIDLQFFRHLTSVVASYAFLFPSEDGVPHRMLLPLLDMINHANQPGANLHIMQAESGDIYAYTLRDIRAGEELKHTYTTGIRRNDHCIFHYGFVQESDTPALVEQDLPAGNLYDVSPYAETDYDIGGPLSSKAELQRLQAVLDSFTTTAAQDAELLQVQTPWWKFWARGVPRNDLERMFVQYRMMRKEGLHYVVQKLKDALMVTHEL
ncbi:hypothetical protein CVIRNUC_000553 [Coccomyxa viridis]|uniref:SET domain-containing protein n=1 Tax=Coccomyxa viridis TaxID=1274662 RepID=A0AAV1HS53_9CHLO|nr:hypothetical protein CVIRNUC_000553 [Coccomyxa viridis]